jgi:hypothetical protein
MQGAAASTRPEGAEAEILNSVPWTDANGGPLTLNRVYSKRRLTLGALKH